MTTEGGGMVWEAGERFKRKEPYAYLGLIHVGVGQKTTKFCKVIILQIKNKLIKKYIYNAVFLPRFYHYSIINRKKILNDSLM